MIDARDPNALNDIEQAVGKSDKLEKRKNDVLYSKSERYK